VRDWLCSTQSPASTTEVDPSAGLDEVSGQHRQGPLLPERALSCQRSFVESGWPFIEEEAAIYHEKLVVHPARAVVRQIAPIPADLPTYCLGTLTHQRFPPELGIAACADIY